jgi:hypothetical protein
MWQCLQCRICRANSKHDTVSMTYHDHPPRWVYDPTLAHIWYYLRWCPEISWIQLASNPPVSLGKTCRWRQSNFAHFRLLQPTTDFSSDLLEISQQIGFWRHPIHHPLTIHKPSTVHFPPYFSGLHAMEELHARRRIRVASNLATAGHWGSSSQSMT